MKSPEGNAYDKGSVQIYEGISKHEGLEGELYSLCDHGVSDPNDQRLHAVANILATDRFARRDTIAFLSEGGRGYQRDAEIAETLREKLAWQLVEILASD